jgi:hypothetical protein
MRHGKVLKEAALHLNEQPVFEEPKKELEYLRAENAYLRDARAERSSQEWA